MAASSHANRRRLVAGHRRIRPATRPAAAQATSGWGWQWVLALLPVFPVLLLVLRLWVLSRQNLATMLLLVQQVNPLALASALVFTLAWVPPMVALTGCVLGLLQLVSRPRNAEPRASWFATRAARTPGWVIVIFVAWAAVTWQLRFLPMLVALTLAIVGLTTRLRYGDQQWLVRIMCHWLPLVGMVVLYGWLAPGILEAFDEADVSTAILLAGSPALAYLLAGPIPRSSSRVVTQWFAATAAFVTPFIVGAIFLATPVLPEVAVEIETDTGMEAVRSTIVAVDDRMTTLLSRDGSVRFVLNDLIQSKVLCPSSEQIPISDVQVRGWGVEQTVIEFLAPPAVPPPDDPRCQGRPLAG